MTEQHHHIINFRAENVKRLQVVEIAPGKKGLVEIAGKNGQGKTSILDAILWAFSSASAVQSMPIRKGTDHAAIEVTIGDDQPKFIIERRFTENGSYLSITTPDGMRPAKPQKLLDTLLGKMAFDPLQFMHLKADKQAEMLRDLAGVGPELDTLDEKIAQAMEARKMVKKEAEAFASQAAAIQTTADDSASVIDEDEIVKRMTSISTINADISRRATNRANAREDIDRWRREAEQIETRIEELKAQCGEYLKRADEKEKQLAAAGPLPELTSADDIAEELRAAKAHNAEVSKWETKKAAKANADKKAKEADTLTKTIEAARAEKLKLISAAALPVEGLSFDASGVTYGGIPLDQASDAQQLRISVAIASALNPGLRVIRIRDGSLLDDDSMKMLADFANKNDLQIWIETVGTGMTPGAIIIEDGQVKA